MNNPTAKKIVSKAVPFAKKHKLVLSIATVVIVVSVILFTAVPVVSLGGLKLVNLNTPVRIEEGQTVQLKNKNVSVKIVRFSDDVCPKGQKCFGSGPAAEYSLSVDGKVYVAGSQQRAANSDYQVDTMSSDFKTYAEVKIIKTR